MMQWVISSFGIEESELMAQDQTLQSHFPTDAEKSLYFLLCDSEENLIPISSAKWE